MKKIVLQITIIFFVLFVNKAYSQRDFDRIKDDEFLENIPHRPKANSCYECDIPDIGFHFKTGFGTAIDNYLLSQRAQRKEYERWYARQQNLIKDYLSSRFGKSFSSFNAARNELFKELQRKDGYPVYRELVAKYGSKVNVVQTNIEKRVKNLKLLRLREGEIKSGKINASAYPNFVVSGKKLIAYKSQSSIKRVWNSQYSNFVWHQKDFYVKTSFTKSPYYKESSAKNFILNGDIKYYNNFNEWDRLNLMIFLINVENNNINLRPPRVFPSQFLKYQNYGGNTLQALDSKIVQTKKVEYSIFDNRILSSPSMPPHVVQQIMNQRKVILNNLIKNTPINKNSSVDFIVEDLNITDLDAIEWLNTISHIEATKIKEVLARAKTNSSPDLDLGDIYRFARAREIARIDNGKSIVKMAKELELDKYSKKWLCNNENKSLKVKEFIDTFRVNGKISNKDSRIIFSSFYYNNHPTHQASSTQFSDFQRKYDRYDPKLSVISTKKQYEEKIKYYIDYFKRRGEHEFANYLQSLLPLDSSYTKEDYVDLYETIRNVKVNLLWKYVRAIFNESVDAFQPVIELALAEVGGGIAIKILQKLPVRYLTTPIKNVINRLKKPTSSAFSNLNHAKKYGIKSYSGLGETFKELGLKLSKLKLERHHLIEKRFFKNTKIRNQLKQKFGNTTDDWLSIIVDKGVRGSEHDIFSKAWIRAIGRDGTSPGWTGKTTSTATFNDIIRAAKEIYKDYPEILKALGI